MTSPSRPSWCKIMFAFEDIGSAWAFLRGLTPADLIFLFWFTVLFEIPRYLLEFLATAATAPKLSKQLGAGRPSLSRVSILIAGHNEEESICRCVAALREQTYADAEIICVDDGSTDSTFALMASLEREGQIDRAVRCSLRGGKSSALNLAARLARGDILIVVDSDCTFDRDAVAEILSPFVDPRVAAVSGNILARNWRASIVASLQAIEYLIAISLGKAASDLFNQVSCVSGAFGAFRRDAWSRLGGMDVGPGEDFDITMRLRIAGYNIAFAPRAICYTDVPDTLEGLARQRSRWERDAFWIRLRKFRRTLAPSLASIRWQETIHQLDFIVFNVAAAALFPIYVLVLFMEHGEFAIVVLIAASLGLYVMDGLSYALAVWYTGKRRYWRLAPFLVIYGPFQSYVMRFIRLSAYIDEWILSRSREDEYVPEKVRAWSSWR